MCSYRWSAYLYLTCTVIVMIRTHTTMFHAKSARILRSYFPVVFPCLSGTRLQRKGTPDPRS